MTNLTDKQRVELAKAEYFSHPSGRKVTVNNGKIKIGTVSSANNYPSGEQSYVVTDKNIPPTASAKDRARVKHVTLLYRGSTAPSFGMFNPKTAKERDTVSDWEVNDIPASVGILTNIPMGKQLPQYQTASHTLQETMRQYPNARFELYGHSLGSMDVQYAMANLSEKQLDRIDGGYAYEGPDIYQLLSPSQKRTADELRKRRLLFSYTDSKDLVPIGYGHGAETVGVHILIDSVAAKDKVAQHMWGGYHFTPDGQLVKSGQSVASMGIALANGELGKMQTLKKKLQTKNGGKLSGSQKIFLDAMAAQAIVKAYQYWIFDEVTALEKTLKKDKKIAQAEWRKDKSDAQRIGEHLSTAETQSALASVGATQTAIETTPVNKAISRATLIKAAQEDLSAELKLIQSTMAGELADDTELADMFN